MWTTTRECGRSVQYHQQAIDATRVHRTMPWVVSFFILRLRAGLANSVRKQCKAAGIVDTSANLWKFYVNKCRNNLHLVLAMSPSGDKLRLRCRSFPGLISNCVIDWFFPWPEDALSKVAEFFLNLCAELASKRVPVMQQIAQHHDSVGIVFFGE